MTAAMREAKLEGGAVGAPLPRPDSRRFVCGQGRYTDDIALPRIVSGRAIHYGFPIIRTLPDISAQF